MANQRKIVGQRLREAREALGLRLADVARAVGVSVAFVSDVELGNRSITDARRGDFAGAVDLPTADLTELDETTLLAVESRLQTAGRCNRALRIVREMATEGAAR